MPVIYEDVSIFIAFFKIRRGVNYSDSWYLICSNCASYFWKLFRISISELKTILRHWWKINSSKGILKIETNTCSQFVLSKFLPLSLSSPQFIYNSGGVIEIFYVSILYDVQEFGLNNWSVIAIICITFNAFFNYTYFMILLLKRQ